MAEPTESSPAPAARTDRSPWNWLLVLPIVLPVLTPIYNFDSPRLWGFPAFYWLQFAWILVGVATTSLVYQMTRKRRVPAPAAPPARPAALRSAACLRAPAWSVTPPAPVLCTTPRRSAPPAPAPPPPAPAAPAAP